MPEAAGHPFARGYSQPVAGVGREGGEDDEQQGAQEILRAHPGGQAGNGAVRCGAVRCGAVRCPPPGPRPPEQPPPQVGAGQAAAGAARWMRPRRPPSPTVSSAGPSRDGAEGRGRAGGGGSPGGGPTSLLLGRVPPLGTPPGRDGSGDGTGAAPIAALRPRCCPSAVPAALCDGLWGSPPRVFLGMNSGGLGIPTRFVLSGSFPCGSENRARDGAWQCLGFSNHRMV